MGRAERGCAVDVEMSTAPRHTVAGSLGFSVAAALLLLAGAGLHLWYLIDNCPLDLSGDEAHYWEWSRRPDWSYYSKGPLIAWLIYAGRLLLGSWSHGLVGSEMLAVRVPAIVLSVVSGWGIYVLSARVLQSRSRGLAALGITFTMPILAAGSMLMTIDAPLTCLWVWTLVAVERGVRTRRAWPWLVAGLLIAAGVLAKYTMVLIYPVIVGAVWMYSRHDRERARSAWRGAAFSLLIGLLGWLPIVFWNAQHGWVSFRHVAGQAGVAGGITLNPLGPLEYLLGQAAVANPVWFVVALLALAAGFRQGFRHDTGCKQASFPVILATLATITPWAAFGVASLITKIQPNWPVLSLATAPALIVWWLSHRGAKSLNVPRQRTVVITTAVTVGLIANVILHHTEWLTPVFRWWTRAAPPWDLTPVANLDPTARLRGWRELGRAAGKEFERLRAGDALAFLMTDDYQVASQLAFYAPGNPVVYCCQSALGDRMCQYDLWHGPLRNPQDFIGRPCLYVGRFRPEWIEQQEGAPPLPGLEQVAKVEHRVRGVLYNVWSIYRCEEFAGFQRQGTELRRY